MINEDSNIHDQCLLFHVCCSFLNVVKVFVVIDLVPFYISV